MNRREILVTRYGEMMDMLACLSIYEGNAEPKRKKKTFSFDEAINLR